EDAIATALRLATEEGIFAGISAGATVDAALQVARGAEPDAVILAMLPDTGERYFSTPLFEGVNEGSDDDWLAGLLGRVRPGRPIRRGRPGCWHGRARARSPAR